MVSLRSLPKIACSSCSSRRLRVGGDRLGLLLGELGEVGRRGHAGAQRRQAGRDADHLAAAGAGLLVEGERAGAADVPLAGTRGEAGHRLGDAVVAGQEGGDVARCRASRASRVRQRERIVGSTSCTVGAHSSQIVLGGGLLDRLEQGVAGARVLRGAEPVGVLDHHDLPAARSAGTSPPTSRGRACRRRRAPRSRTSPR